MVDFGTPRFLTGYNLTPVPAGETLVFPLLRHLLFCLPLHADSPPPILYFHLLSWWLILNNNGKENTYML